MGHLYLSAAHKSSGKTTISIGICAALARRGLLVQPFKKGPDYIDPIWLTAASGHPCYNLDFYTMARDEILELFARHAGPADFTLIEGNKGLYDGIALDGSDSNAAMAATLTAPVVLVLDVRGMTRGVAPLLQGYLGFAEGINISGVICNQVAGSRHEGKVRRVIEHYTDLPVIGMVGRDEALNIDERHLGLMPSNELAGGAGKIAGLAQAVADQVDLDRLLALTAERPEPATANLSDGRAPEATGPRIGYFADRAFGFYYADDLDRMRALGARLIPIDAMAAPQLPRLDGLMIGGGFPEVEMEALSANQTLRRSVAEFIEAGGVVYAECGGLMYLTRSITWGERSYPMVGVIQADTRMHPRPQGRGYVRLRETGLAPWGTVMGAGEEIAAHEFHHSALTNLADGYPFAYEVTRGVGIDGGRDGLIYKNLLASYTHMRGVGGNRWVERFVQLASNRGDPLQ
jgi:cobyrinic acid a,c-diamide synthase